MRFKQGDVVVCVDADSSCWAECIQTSRRYVVHSTADLVGSLRLVGVEALGGYHPWFHERHFILANNISSFED